MKHNEETLFGALTLLLLMGCDKQNMALLNLNTAVDEKVSCDAGATALPRILATLDTRSVDDLDVGISVGPYFSSAPVGPPDLASECEEGFVDCENVGALSLEIMNIDTEPDTLGGTYTLTDDEEEKDGIFTVKRCDTEGPICD